MIYLETGSADPHFNLAFEEYVLLNRRQGDYLMLWQNENSIIIGQNQNTYAEINREYVEKNHVHVVRRSTGGGAVYHDLGNLNYSFITDDISGGDTMFRMFTEPVVEALKSLGLDAGCSGRNDILVDGRKVSGIAQRHADGRILHHGTLLFQENLAAANEALHVDTEKIRAKGIQSVRSRIANISEYLDGRMTLPEFWEYIKNYFARSSYGGEGFVSGSLSEEELAEVRRIRKGKYDTWEWNYGKSWTADYTSKNRYDGGSIEVKAKLYHGRIEDIVFFGDFMSTQPLDEICAKLKGCEFRPEAVGEVLAGYDLTEYFGKIKKDEIIALF